jgi:hypothetical protein
MGDFRARVGQFFNRNQSQEPQQSACRLGDRSCGTTQVDTQSYRQAAANAAQPAQLPGASVAPSQAVPQYSSGRCGQIAQPVDTSKATDLGNGVHAQVNRNGTVTVVLPLPNGGRSQVDYNWTKANESAPRQTIGYSENFRARGATGDPLVFHRQENGSLQITVTGPTTGAVWIDNERHELDPTKIKAEIARIKTAAAPASTSPAATVTPSPTTPPTSTVSPTPTPPTLSAPTPSAAPTLPSTPAPSFILPDAIPNLRLPMDGPTPPPHPNLPFDPSPMKLPSSLPSSATPPTLSSPSYDLPSLPASTPATAPTMRDPLPTTEGLREVQVGDGANIPSAVGREILSEINRGLSTLSEIGKSVVGSLTSGAAGSGAATTGSVTTPPSSSTSTPTPSTGGASTTPPVSTVSTVTPVVADLPNAPTPDPKLAELRGKIQLAIGQLTGVESFSTAGDIKAVLQALLKTVNEVENNLREHRNELATRWTDSNLTTAQREAIAKQITEIDKALTGGLAAAVEKVGARRPENLTKFDTEEFSKQFTALLAPPPTPAPAALSSGAGTAGSSTGTTTVAPRESNGALKGQIEDLQAQLEELSLIPGDGLDQGRIELKRLIEQTQAIEQTLLREYEKLQQEISPKNTDKDKQILERIAQIDELLETEIPALLNELGKNTTITLINSKIKQVLGDELKPLNEAPSLDGQQLSAGEQREIEIDPGEAIQIRHNGEIIAKIQRNIDGSLSHVLQAKQDAPVSLEINGAKLILRIKADLATETSLTLDRIESATGVTKREEPFKGTRRETLDPTNVAEVERIKSRIEELQSSFPTNQSLLEALVKLDKFVQDGDGVKITSPDGKYEFRVNRNLEVSAVALPATAPAPAASSTPSTAPAATAPATEVSKEVEQIKVAVSTLPDSAAREQFLKAKAMGFIQRGSDFVKVSTKDPSQNILVKDITGTPSVELEPVAPATPVGASEEAQKQVEGLNAALSTLSDPDIFKSYLSAQGFKAEGDTLVKTSIDPNYNIVVDNTRKAILVKVAPATTPTPPSPAPELPRSVSGHSSPESTALPSTREVPSGTTTPATSPTATVSFKPTREQALAALETEKAAALKHATETHKDDVRDLAYATSEIDYVMEYASGAINTGNTEMTLEMAAIKERNEVVLGELGYERSTNHPAYLVRKIGDGYRMINPALGLAEEQVIDARGIKQAYYQLNDDLTRGTLYASFERQPSGKYLQTGGEHKWVRGSWLTAADIEKLDLTVHSIEGKLNDFSATEEERLMVMRLLKETEPGHRSYIVKKYEELTSRTLENDLDHHFRSGWHVTTPEQEGLDRLLFGFSQWRQADVIDKAMTYDRGALGWDDYEAVVAATSDLNGFQRRAIEHTFNRMYGQYGPLRQRFAYELTVDERKSEIMANLNFK